MYFYHAHAIAFGGNIGSAPLKVEQGSCALAVTGGLSSANAADFNFQDIVFKSAKSQVSGEETTKNSGPDTYVTKASVILQGLNIKNVVKADRIVANVQSTYTARDYEAVTTVSGSIEGLSIQGKAVTVQISQDLETRYTTFGSLQGAFQNRYSQPFLGSLVGSGLTPQIATSEDLKAAYQAYQEQVKLSQLKSAVVCSLVQGVDNLPDGAAHWGPIINVPGFGNIYLGEVIVWPWMRCLTMFRIELIGPDKKSVVGRISGGSAGANGTGYPPGAGASGNGW